MNEQLRVLVAVDDSEASERALTYTGGLLAGRDGARIYPVHVLGPLPPELLGSEGEAISDDRRNRQAAWMAEARSDAKPLLDKACRLLEGSGVRAGAIEPRTVECTKDDAVADTIVEAARASGCGTIVVGRESVSWAPQLFYRHIGETVVKEAADLAVWIVG